MTTWSRRARRTVFAVACAAASGHMVHPVAAQTSPAAQASPQVQTGLPASTDTQAQKNPLAPSPAKPWAPPASLSDWASTIATSGQVDAGIVVNPQNPDNGVNYGRLFTDKANRPILNQLLLTLERDTDPKATGYDFGFKLQGLYGSDARIVHLLGVFDHLIHDRNQLAITEADISVHAPWLFGGGVDIKAGIFPSPLGFEVTDAHANPFYSHSYIFNVLPYEHFGVLSVSHASSMLDLYLGFDTGAQTTIADGDNNRRPAGIAGFGLNLLGGNLTVLALSHIGPEDAKRAVPFADSALRFYNDIVITYKASDNLSFTTELNYAKEDGYRAEGYGGAQYVSYSLTKTLTLNGRAEVWRDADNFFISTPVNNLDYVNSERGYKPANFYTASGPTTYSELTAGVTYKPAGLQKPVGSLMVRPEIRYDRSLSGTKPFDGGKDKGSVTLATDVILGF